MKVQVAKWGNSTAVRLLKSVVRQLRLTTGMTLYLTVDQGAIFLSAGDHGQGAPRPQPLTLVWIVSEMRRLGPEQGPETVGWGGDVGAEIIDDDVAH